jgi:hypothetical protein
VDFWYPDDDAPIDPNWWAPLMRFGLAAARDGLPALDPEEFMLMGRIVRNGRPDLWLFKHIFSRRYANLDVYGEPYRYIPPKDVLRSKSDGRYVTQDHRSAWCHLDLLDCSPALQPDRSEEVCEDSSADDADWPFDDLSAA